MQRLFPPGRQERTRRDTKWAEDGLLCLLTREGIAATTAWLRYRGQLSVGFGFKAPRAACQIWKDMTQFWTFYIPCSKAGTISRWRDERIRLIGSKSATILVTDDHLGHLSNKLAWLQNPKMKWDWTLNNLQGFATTQYKVKSSPWSLGNYNGHF